MAVNNRRSSLTAAPSREDPVPGLLTRLTHRATVSVVRPWMGGARTASPGTPQPACGLLCVGQSSRRPVGIDPARGRGDRSRKSLISGAPAPGILGVGTELGLERGRGRETESELALGLVLHFFAPLRIGGVPFSRRVSVETTL